MSNYLELHGQSCHDVGTMSTVNHASKQSEPRKATMNLWPEVGALLGLSRGATYAAAKRGEIPIIRFGRRVLVPRAALDRLLNGRS